MNGKTVVVIGSYAPSLVNFRGPLLGELVRRGYRVVAMAPALDPATRARLTAIGAVPREFPVVNASLNPLAMRKASQALQRVFAEEKPAGVIAYTIKPVTLGCVAAARAKVPVVVALITGLGFAFTEGSGWKRRISRVAATLLYGRALRRCTAIIFQNRDDRDFFRQRRILPKSPEPAVVSGSGVDVAQFDVAPLPAAPCFLMISRLLGDKGTREYGEAVRRLKQRHPQASFRLVGYFDPSPDSLTEAELARMVEGGVEYLGRMDDVRPALADAGIYVLPSYREGMPRSVLEAMAMGRAIVTTDAPGCRETVVDGENGFLVPPRDAAALEEAMERFIVDPSLIRPMGARSRRMAEDIFDVRWVNEAVLAAAGL